MAVAVLAVASLQCTPKTTGTACALEDERMLLKRMHQSLDQAKARSDDVEAILLEDPALQDLFRKPRTHGPGIRMIVADPTVDVETKALAVRLVQCLRLPAYVEFLRFVLDEVRRGNCDASILHYAIYPGDLWGAVVVDNYQNAEVQRVLQEIKRAGLDDKALDEIIADALDGSYAKYVEYLRIGDGRVPFIACDER